MVLLVAEDGHDRVIEFTPGEDKLVILDVNESPTTLAGLFDSLIYLSISGDANNDHNLSSSELDAGARVFIDYTFSSRRYSPMEDRHLLMQEAILELTLTV